jgi:hypothetical protein
VHLVDFITSVEVLFAPLRKNLFTNQVYEILNVCVSRQLKVFLWMLEAQFDSVEDWSAHRLNERLFVPICHI